MVQISKLKKSYNEWKRKAIEKTYEAKELRKAQTYYKKINAKLREENKKLRQKNDEIKKKY